MAKFVYRMESVLNVKLQLETQAKAELAEAQNHLRDEQDALKALRNRKLSYEEEGKQMRQGTIHAADLRNNALAMKAMDELIEKQMKRVEVAGIAMNRARRHLEEVIQERKIQEKLKERAFEEFMEEERHAEAKEVDELVSYKFGQKIKEEAHGE